MRPSSEFPTIRSAATSFAAALLLTACGGAETPDGKDATASSSGAAESCVAQYAESPCDLLTEAMLREHYPDAPAEIEQTDLAEQMESVGMSTTIGGMVQNGCTYSWDGGRTKSFGKSDDSESDNPIEAALSKLTQNVPIDDSIALRSIRAIEADDPVARFERQWRAPTQEEREMLARRMEEKMDEAREEGKLSDSGAEMGKNLGKSMAGASISYEDVDGVGTVARWGGVGSQLELRVLDGATEFAVAVDVSDDEAMNRELAIAVAKDLLASCDG